MSPTYDYPRPAVTVDCVVFGLGRNSGSTDGVQILLIERRSEPYEGCWALPGGFVDPDETAEDAASRELEEETRLNRVRLEQLHTFSTPGRDPRGWVISIAFVGIVDPEACVIEAQSDARQVRWFDLDSLPKLAFDHGEIVARGRAWLEGQTEHEGGKRS
jgi:8-oxo-dGTP diphosphatase